MPAADRLLRALDRLPYPVRQRAIANEARRLAGTPDLRPILDDLSARGRYERSLATALAAIAPDLEFLLGCLADQEVEITPVLLRAAVTLSCRSRL